MAERQGEFLPFVKHQYKEVESSVISLRGDVMARIAPLATSWSRSGLMHLRTNHSRRRYGRTTTYRAGRTDAEVIPCQGLSRAYLHQTDVLGFRGVVIWDSLSRGMPLCIFKEDHSTHIEGRCILDGGLPRCLAYLVM